MIEHMNIIETLNDQIEALLDLMMMIDKDGADFKSIKTASEMCFTMQMELMAEVNKMYEELKNAATNEKTVR